uniref:ubiquitinyl hydrolase 1 n=1 Tax=Pundamilia nyererei TaxID=303518 RepID=A0A3B4GGY9_9CICH
MQKGLKKYFVNMDEYLCSLGLYRKMVARDASSLFRAVSEQLYFSQNYHQKIRQDCANFMRANRCNFEPVSSEYSEYERNTQLLHCAETVGQVEIKALSQLYRRCFLIYRYPGKPATIISEDDFVDKVTLCCSINGHYDIVYPRSYPASAALCQSLLYELLYTQVFGFEEAELCQAMEAFRVGGRRYRNSPSMCSDVDLGYDTPEDRRNADRCRFDRPKAPPPSRLSLPYKVMKSLDGDVYRNLEFDVWQDTCKEMQKTDYMVFAGRQYFLGDKCQVRLEPKGKYYNAFIQEVGTHSSAVTVFIEELGEKHLVPLTDLKPVNPVPAWNVAAPSRKGDLGASFFFSPSTPCFVLSFSCVTHLTSCTVSSRLSLRPGLSWSAASPPSLLQEISWDEGNRAANPTSSFLWRPRPLESSTRFLNRHLIGTQLTYYHPGRRYYQDYESFTFRSRRSRRQLAAALNKECQFGFPEAVEEPADLDAAISYYQLDGDGVFPPLPVSMSPPSGSSYRVQRGSGPLSPAPPPRNTPVCSSEEEQEDISTVEDQGEDATSHWFSVGCHTLTRFLVPVAMAIPAASSWLVNELGEPLCTVVAPPPYSYDPNGSDLPRGQNMWFVSSGVSMESSSSISPTPPGSAPSSALLYPDQSPLPPPLPLLHLPYEAPPPSTYLTTAPAPPLPHPAHHPHHSSYHPCLPSSVHWGPISTGGHAPRLYCPAPNPSHVVGYIAAPSPHHTATHYIPPTM